MRNLKISVITVSYNAGSTIGRCIQSVLSQSYNNIEYIIIDGGSADDTVNVISRYRDKITHFVSETDNGIYDAMNKGLSLATGDIAGMLNADDFYADDNVLAGIAEVFDKSGVDAVYGDLDYIDKGGQVVRRWRSGAYRKGKFNYGWMPPHPTFYCKMELYRQLGNYSLKYGTAGDYELMLRFIHLNNVSLYYLQKILIKMRVGGVSNSNAANRIRSLRFDLKAMYNNNIMLPPITLMLKPLRKLRQFF